MYLYTAGLFKQRIHSGYTNIAVVINIGDCPENHFIERFAFKVSNFYGEKLQCINPKSAMIIVLLCH